MMNPGMKKKLLVTAVAGAALLGSQAAMAQLITEWGYQVDSGFSAWAPDDADSPNVGVTALNENPNLPGTFTRLEWGDPANGSPSAFTVTPTVTDPPTLFTNGAFVDGAELTHENFPLFSATSDSLTSATLLSSLILMPMVPPGLDAGPFVSNFEIAFQETPNNPGSGICADGTSVDDHPNGCPDIFVLTNPEALTSVSFSRDGFLYTVFIDALGLMPLSDEACAATGVGPGCIGFITEENATNILQAQFRIEARQIPEPLTLGLLGLGLVGLGGLGMARRREHEEV